MPAPGSTASAGAPWPLPEAARKQFAAAEAYGLYVRPSTRPGTPPHTYDVPVTLLGRPMTLELSITPDFPREPPRVALAGDVMLAHPWITHNGAITRCPKLNTWSFPSTSLGAVLQDIVHELDRNAIFNLTAHPATAGGAATPPPPPPLSSSPGIAYPLPRPAAGKGAAARVGPPPAPHPDLADPEKALPSDLAQKSAEEVAYLIEHPEALAKWIQSAPALQAAIAARSAVFHRALAVAKSNVAAAEQLGGATAALDAAVAEMAAARSAFGAAIGAQNAASARFTSDALHEQLRDALADVEQASETGLHTFLGGDHTVEAFVAQHRDHRRLYHKRRFMLERLELQ
ncbi:hypothetical protein CXG81DRAFT_20921 [Caulochytrium protostelioides]|uniref:VPS37 C-terminal domain-containing protein n=1 Tax=Caulochytrium protostelioides TaxID=1555241 RepID=A0A4P9X1V4_9FUNG|nr:hypothetical protein CXG81DRAFT_20921 [Caulochytrium protostelioides]|eukprot:RKO98928.1 hypothetical protein CXG81DRAFT_20921 [Caulochytrium protostelioides]